MSGVRREVGVAGLDMLTCRWELKPGGPVGSQQGVDSRVRDQKQSPGPSNLRMAWRTGEPAKEIEGAVGEVRGEPTLVMFWKQKGAKFILHQWECSSVLFSSGRQLCLLVCVPSSQDCS